MKLVHPKCGKQFPNSSRAGHCSGCCETFIGLASFENHRTGDHATGRSCQIKPYTSYHTEYPHTIVFGHWQDDDGYWHFGEKLTTEQKAKMWGKD